MELLEPIETLNTRLLTTYGFFDTTNQATWRVVWSEDQIEKRWKSHTDEGFECEPYVTEVPKYRQWIHEKYVLERLTVYPEFIERDVVNKLSYEPVWVFEDNKGNPLPPKWQAIYLIIEQVHKQAFDTVSKGTVKYKDPEVVNAKDAPEKQRQDILKIERELFGNETDTGTSLAYKEGISVPSNYEGSNNGKRNDVN